MSNDRGNSGILMQEIDNEKITEAMEEHRRDGWSELEEKILKDRPLLGWEVSDSPAHVYKFDDGSIWLIVIEGVGWHKKKTVKLPIKPKYGEKIDRDGRRSFLAGVTADATIEYTIEELCSMLKPELVPIESESVVRRFGMRLESNLQANIRAIKEKQQEIKLLSEEE